MRDVAGTGMAFEWYGVAEYGYIPTKIFYG